MQNKKAITMLRNELLINLHFWIDLFVPDFVKKPRGNTAISTFFALSVTKNAIY